MKNLKGKNNTYYSVIGYRRNVPYVLAENTTFEEALSVFEKRAEQFENVNIVEEYSIPSAPKNLLVIANAECSLQETKELVDRPLKLKETFLFLGNYLDGSSDFYLYLSFLANLRKKRKCIFVKGINEHNILERINGTENYIGDKEEALKLVQNLERSLTFHLSDFPRKFPEIYSILEDSLEYFENDEFIFVPGGLNLSIEYWKQSSREELCLTTEDFLLEENETGKKIVFGNIPVSELRSNGDLKPWINNHRNKIGINGGCKQGGKLYGLSLIDNDISFISVRSKRGRSIRNRNRELTNSSLYNLK